MDLKEKMISSKEIYRGHILDLFVDKVSLPNGKESTREVIRHCKASAVLAMDEEGNICKISAPKGSYSFPLSQEYAAEYYYDTSGDSCHLRFVFVFGAGEEYRFYFLQDGRCIRYIGPDGQETDYPSPKESLEDVTDKWVFCTQGNLEIS